MGAKTAAVQPPRGGRICLADGQVKKETGETIINRSAGGKSLAVEMPLNRGPPGSFKGEKLVA